MTKAEKCRDAATYQVRCEQCGILFYQDFPHECTGFTRMLGRHDVEQRERELRFKEAFE